MTAKSGRPTLRTVDGDREALQRLLRCRLVKTPLAMVNENTLDAVEAELASRYSSRTIKNTWAVLAKALAQAVKWKRITRNPAQTTDAPEVARNRKVRHYTLEEMLALQRACATSCDPHPVLPAYVAVAFMTGARPEELLALQWPDIDFAAGEFRVTKVLARSQKLGHYVRTGAKTEDSETMSWSRSLRWKRSGRSTATSCCSSRPTASAVIPIRSCSGPRLAATSASAGHRTDSITPSVTGRNVLNCRGSVPTASGTAARPTCWNRARTFTS